MFVDRKEIKIETDFSGSTAYTINIPLKLTFTPTDNSELVEDKWVKDEVKKSINPITDFKKVRFKPAIIKNGVWEIVDEFKFKLNFFTKESIRNGSPAYNTTNTSTENNRSTYGDIGFSDEDLFCRVSRLINSYLTLNFYDNPNPGSNNLITFTNIFTQISLDQKDIYGIPLPANDNIALSITGCPITLRIGDPTLKPNTVHEGFHIYWFEDLVKGAPNNEYIMYLSPTYQNASNGEVSIMYPVKTTLGQNNKANINLNEISGVGGDLYIKVILKYDTTDDIFKYTFVDNDNVNQLNVNGGGINMNATDTVTGDPLPTITLWQLMPNGDK